MQSLYSLLAKFALIVHNYAYIFASIFAIRSNNGEHPKHRIIRYHDFFLSHIGTEDTVIDIGCSDGALTIDLAGKAKHVIGIEIEQKHYESALRKNQADNIEYIQGDATTHEFSTPVNVSVLSNVLEHIEERPQFVKKIAHIAPKLLIRVPMINRDWITLYKKEMGVEWRLDKTHYTEYTREAFEQEMQEAGVHIQELTIQFGEIWAVIQTQTSTSSEETTQTGQ